MGGALRHLRGFMPALDDEPSGNSYTLLARQSISAQFEAANIRVEPIDDAVSSSMFSRLWYDNVVLPRMLREGRYDALVSLANMIDMNILGEKEWERTHPGNPYMPTVTLDWLTDRFPPPRVLKIDVEGAEEHVLRGGERLLGEACPIVLCEVSGQHCAIAGKFLSACVYAELSKEKRLPLTDATWNTLAFPQECIVGKAASRQRLT